MDRLDIYLMGLMRVRLGGRELAGFPTRKSRALFAFLVLQSGRVLPREAVAAQFWGTLSEARARKALSTEVWRVRGLLGAAGLCPERYLQTGSEGIGFRDDAPHWVDVAEVQRAVARAIHCAVERADEGLLGDLERAVALCRGDLLEDVHDDWCLLPREMLRAHHRTALDFLMHARMSRREWPAAVDAGQRLLALDPLQEHVYRGLMQCFHAVGNRPAAIRQFRACARTLWRELGVEPMPETRSVYQAIVSTPPANGLTPQRPEPVGKSVQEGISQAIENLDVARDLLVDASEQLQTPPDPTRRGGAPVPER